MARSRGVPSGSGSRGWASTVDAQSRQMHLYVHGGRVNISRTLPRLLRLLRRQRHDPPVSEAAIPQTPTKRLTDALDNAELLVEFGARNGLDLPSDMVTGVSQARSLHEQGLLQGDQEAAFYNVYNRLAKALGKVTVGSIKDSREEFGELHPKFWFFGPSKRYSRANLVVRRFRLDAWIALTLLILVQIYWLWGTTLLDSMDEAQKAYLDVRAKANLPVSKEAYNVETDYSRALEQRERFRLDIINVQNRIVVYHRSLERWSAPSLWFQRLAPTQSVNWSTFPAETLTRKIQSESLCKMLQTFFLPLLYGWLGALTYVLRQLIVEMRDRTFSAEAKGAFTLRVMLGVIAGLAIGWFAQPTGSEGFVKTAAPFALSFVAGYGVEVLYSAMDRIVTAFGSLSQSSKA